MEINYYMKYYSWWDIKWNTNTGQKYFYSNLPFNHKELLVKVFRLACIIDSRHENSKLRWKFKILGNY